MAVVAATLFMGLGAGGYSLLAGDGNERTPTQEAPAALGLDVSPTPVPPTATPSPVPPTPVPPPEPVEAPPRSCAEIRATGYESDAERSFFLASCNTTTATATPRPATISAAQPPPAQPSGPAPAAGPTQEELSYRNRATSALAYFAVRLDRLDDSVSRGTAAYLELASVLQQMANSLDSIAPVPSRFRDVHDELRASLLETTRLLLAATGNRASLTAAESRALSGNLLKAVDRLENALDDYDLVVGTKIKVK